MPASVRWRPVSCLPWDLNSFALALHSSAAPGNHGSHLWAVISKAMHEIKHWEWGQETQGPGVPSRPVPSPSPKNHTSSRTPMLSCKCGLKSTSWMSDHIGTIWHRCQWHVKNKVIKLFIICCLSFFISVRGLSYRGSFCRNRTHSFYYTKLGIFVCLSVE